MIKVKITLFNENQYFIKELIGISISHKTACSIYNSVTKPKLRGCFNMNPHELKCNDSFSIKDSRIRMISFYGNKIDMVVFNDGFISDSIQGKYELLK